MIRKNKLSSMIAILTVALFFGSIGFTVGYYKYSSQLSKQKIERQKDQELLNALIKAQENSLYNVNENETEVTNYTDTINKNTRITYKVFYTQCEHEIKEVKLPTLDLIGLNEEGFKEYLNKNLSGAEIENFSKKEIIINKRENKVCPNHYLISVNNGYISVYKYDISGEKQLIDQTEISIKILPTIDQEKLQRGILVETLEEVNQLLEDYSS